MAILEGYTALVVIVERHGDDNGDDGTVGDDVIDLRVESDVLRSRITENPVSFPVEVVDAYPFPGEHPSMRDLPTPPSTQVTETLLVRAREEPGIVARIAEVMEQYAINIVWMEARVVPVSVASEHDRFELRMDLAIDHPGKRAHVLPELQPHLTELARLNGWELQLLRSAWTGEDTLESI